MKVLRVSLGVMAAALLALLVLVCALWVWSGSGTSLAGALSVLASRLPAGQTLEVKDASGTLRGGGTIGWLRWQGAGLDVQARDVSLGWGLRSLLDGELRLGQLAIGHLRIEDHRPAAAPVAPTELRLPIRVDALFSVATLEWAGIAAPVLTGLQGHYSFDSYQHSLDVRQVHISSGIYAVNARLQAQAPMALSVQLQGAVQTHLPSSQQAVTVQAHAKLQGHLAGANAALELQAQLAPDLMPAASNLKPARPAAQAMQAMQASVLAHIQPWQPQPVVSATGHWQSLDLAALWPQAPQTQLDGEAVVTPAGGGWRANVRLGNSQSGPWNQQRLPVDSLNAKLVFETGQWTLESLQASAAGGRIEAQGKFATVPGTGANSAPVSRWQGQARVVGVNPAAIDSRLAATALDGQLSAQQTSAGIVFESSLQPAGHEASVRSKTVRPAAAAGLDLLNGLHLKAVQAQGQWQAPMLVLNHLRVQTDDAELEGQLTFHTLSQAASGQLALTLPGANAALTGHIASTQGAGEISLNVTDAGLASRWLQRWPSLTTTFDHMSLQGSAALTVRWQGGWQGQGRALQLQAKLRAPQLRLTDSAATVGQPWLLRDVQADLAGTLGALRVSTQAQADNASRHFVLQAQGQGGLMHEGRWQAQLNTAQLSAEDSLRPGLWTLQLGKPLSLDWSTGGAVRTLNLSEGTARLTGAVAGAAVMNWQAAQWSQQAVGGHALASWQTRGSLQGLPLAWLDLLGQTRIANLGLRGDLLFGGQWEASGGETLHLRATLERAGGDLELLGEDSGGGAVRAGVRTARLVISADGEQLTASLRWDSERAGQAQADFSTRLQRAGGVWSWPADAPIRGTLMAQLPPVGAWSMLAPPGWRLRGTLDANATLSGTRGAPQWHGTLQAQDLALRSVVDGIDFSKGSLRASVDGQRLDINEFTLQGAGGSSGGQLSIKGSVLWLDSSAGAMASRLRMALDAELQGLRVSARADRRLVLSGKLTLRLEDARLKVRGALKADEALFILPEDSAARLGDDVLVHQPAASAPIAASTASPLRVMPDVSITLDMGDSFQVRGRGLITRLAGTLALQDASELKLGPRLTGELRAEGGTYKAYGQQLDIETGVLRFDGPYDNPALDILAIRPNLQQRVGVQIGGTARSPVWRLYAESDMTDDEKLAWLLLGRSGASGGAEAAVLQQAALALLGSRGKNLSGGLAGVVGLDELSVRGATAGTTDTSATGATVTLGKRFSRNFYLAYERSLAGTLGTLSIFYDLSRRFTVRAQTGEQSAVDLIFTLRYD